MRDVTQLHPTLQAKIKELKKACAAQGLKIGIGECLRTAKEQDDLYAQGRAKPGAIVTNARGSTYSSMHQWGIAFDFYRDDGLGAFNDYDAFFTNVGRIGQSIGLEWGGAWKSIKDKPHFQLPDWGSTPSKLKSLYGKPEKFFATWGKASADSSTVPSTHSSTIPSNKSKAPSYSVGRTYTLQAEMKVRKGAGTKYAAKKHSELTESAQAHDKDHDGALDKGTRVTCKAIKAIDGDIWMRIPSGWIAAYYNGKIYVK